MDSPPLLVFCFLFTVQLCVSGVILTTFTMVNKCQYTVWPGIVSNAGIAPLSSTGFLLQTGESKTISAPTSWGGRFWGRTQCSQNSTGKFSCVTGDCGSGKLECSGRGATPPATLAEFTLGGSSGLDFFDVSLVDGYNVPLTVVPEGGTGENCKSTGCVVDLIGACPPELKVMSVDGKNGVACKSACEAYGWAEYCCSGAYGSPDKCKASAYSHIFKSACPLAYSYAYDDENSTFTCGHSPDYTVTFCASRITRAIARAPTQPFTPPTNSSSSSSNPRRTAGVPTPAPANNRLRPSIPSKPEIVKFKTSILIVVVVVIVALVVLLLISCLAFYVSKENRSKNYRAVVRNYFGSEGTTLQSLQFTLAKVEDATNKFSPENRIGRGGFGEVYKGILEDGREIAVKKLSKSSGQGDLEFKTEVLLIARLQHRNLVALLGFCLEKTEKLLIYEYVPNKSLDYFLFGPADRRILCWLERHKIIIGIVRGILYLHDHSRLKVIHRDLKPSNILLDEEMNAKISDFGMARIVALSETKGSTNRIVGTYGYMSPEYAMHGQFSEKSDVFSFGVIILEIVSGKRNTNYHEESGCYECFLNYAWRQWRDESVTEILDSNMRDEVSSEIFGEMNKCIHIGLLCVQANPAARPSMEMVLKYLTNDSIQLPFPHEPAFFIHPQTEAMESNVGQRPNNLHPFSVNQMSLSDFFPR